MGLASVVGGICGRFAQFRGILGEVLGFEVEEDGHEGRSWIWGLVRGKGTGKA